MGSAPSLQADSNIVTINARELKSPHCIPVSTSEAIFQMELSDCQQGSYQLLNSPGSLGGPTIMHTGAWRRQACTASGNGTPHNFREPRTGATHAPTIYGTIHPHLAAPTYDTLSPTTYSSLQVSAAFSAFSLQVQSIPVTIHCKFKGPMVTHQNHHPPLITASELNNRTMQVNFH